MQKSKIKGNLSARPKVRTNVFNEAKILYEPLEKKSINFIDQDGNKKSISLISKEFDIKMSCVAYFEPSLKELDILMKPEFEMQKHRWMINSRKYESMLLSLVNMPYFRFWSVMSFNNDVLASLESYLLNSSRPYRLHSTLKNDEFKSVLNNIHKLVFKVFLRMLLSKESEANFMTRTYHIEIVRNILDIPKLLNLVQLYGYGSNSEILKFILKEYIDDIGGEFKNNFKLICDDITQLLNHYLEDDFEVHGDKYLMYNLVANVTDILFSLNKFVLIDPQLSSIYRRCNLPETLLIFYSKYFSFIEKKCDDFVFENLYNFPRNQITLAQSSALLLFHHILQNDFISTINQVNMDNQMFDALINILNSVINQKRFCFDYFTKFSFEKEFHSLLTNQELNEQLSIGDVLEYYKITLKTTITEYLNTNNNDSKHTQNPEKKLCSLMSLNYEQNDSNKSNEIANDIKTDPETTMKEQLIREMFPDFGDGFVYKCLEHYDFDNEKVLDAILENNLPPHLDSLNRQLNKNDLLKARSAAILVQNTNQQKDKYDPTSTKDLELVQIYIGKKDKISNVNIDKDAMKEKTIDLMAKIQHEEEEAKENVKTLMERGKLTKSDLETNIEYLGLYDDEFDDTYENEDASFDPDEIMFDDYEETEEGKTRDIFQPNTFQTNASNSMPFRQPQEKFDNSVRYSKNQFYNKRHFNRKQNQQGDSGQSNYSQTSNKTSNQNSHQNSHQNSQQNSHQTPNPMSNQTSAQNSQPNQNTNMRKNYQPNEKLVENRSNNTNQNTVSGNKGNFYRNQANNRGNLKNQSNRGSYNNQSRRN